MNQRTDQHDPGTDPVWELLAKSPPPQAGPMFVHNVVRAARLAAAGGRGRWWAAPRLLGGIAAAAAAVAIAFLAWQGARPARDLAGVADPAAAAAESLDDLEELAGEELLLEAAEDLSKFSDAELLVLLGF